jgi:H+/Cl- antiporter ClcA
LTSALLASITADFISKNFFGLKPMFDFKHISVLPLDNYFYLLGLGIIVGLMGIIFNKTLLGTQTLFSKQKWLPAKVRPIIPFIMAGVLGLMLPEVLGGGNQLISTIADTSFSIKLLLIILVVKFIFTMISYGSSSPGGIFLPLLVIGALIGVIYGNIIHLIFGFPSQYIENIMILAMAGYFTAIVKAPITGILLITEMTGSFSHLLSVAIVCLTAYVVVDVLNLKPIYESLLERLINKGDSKFVGDTNTKAIIEMQCALDQ